MAPNGKRIRRSGVKNKGKENIPQRKLIRGRPIKRKAQSVEKHVKKRRHNYNLRSCSVEFVCEIPYCENEDTRKKYASLCLDSALFHSKSRPARRKQSHISEITISSSDDDENMERTAEWVESVAIENGDIPRPEEGFNMDLNPSNNRNRASGETEEIRHQFSHLQFPITHSESSRMECSTSSASTPGKYSRSICPQTIESGPIGVCASEKYQISEVAGSVQSGLFCVKSPEKYQSPTLLSHREHLSLSGNLVGQNLTSNNSARTSRFEPLLPSIQESRLHYSSTVEKQQAPASEGQCLFCFVTPNQNLQTKSSEERRPFCTITTESHPILTTLRSEEKSPFYSSTSGKDHNSSVEERSPFCFINSKKEQVSQECRPLCSSTPDCLKSISRFGIEEHNTFCDITIEPKQGSRLVNPPGHRSCFFSNPDPMGVQSPTEVVLRTPSTSMQSSIFANPQHKGITVRNHKNSQTLPSTDSLMQLEKDELKTVNQTPFYFGSLKTHDLSGQLFSSIENTEAQEHNPSYECSISGIEKISNVNTESTKGSIIQEASTTSSVDEDLLSFNMSNDSSQNYDTFSNK